MLAPAVSARGVCARPENLSIVDAAFDGRGGAGAPNQRAMKALCRRCPIWNECLQDALDNGEHGPWGGTVERERNRVTGTRTYRFNMRNVEIPDTSDASRPTQIRNTSRVVKEWAVEMGLIDAVTLTPVTREIIDAYLDTHPVAS